MKKKLPLIISALSLLMFGVALLPKAPPVEVKAVSSTRLYIVVTDQIKAQAPNYILWTGSANVNLALLSTVDSNHAGDIYTYFTDAAISNSMAFKNSGGSYINLYNISNAGKGTTWDRIVFGNVTNWNATAPYTTSVYTPPVPLAEYTVSLYNGATLLGTQTAYEGTQFTPQSYVVSNYTLMGWYTDSGLTTPYTPSVLTGSTSLYAKFEANQYTRIYIESTNSWWYNGSARIDIFFWKSGVSAQVLTMRKEVGDLHSVILPHPSFTGIKLERKDPANPSTIWNATGDITVNLTQYTVIKFSGALTSNYTGPMTVTDFSNTAPDIAYLKTEVPLLSCTNYGNANTLLVAYNRLGNNELSLINALTVNSHDETPIALSYKSVIDYYAAHQNVMTPPGSSQIFQTSTRNNIALFSLLGLSVFALSSYYFIKKKKYLAD